MASNAVKELQRRINAAGYKPPLKVDGIKGSKTRAGEAWLSKQGAGGAAPAAAPAAGPGSIAEQAQREYGYLAAFLNHGEVGPILQEAARDKWDAAKLQGRLFATNWWKQTNQAQRQWDALVGQDPQEANTRITQREAELTRTAKSLGVPVTGRIREIAQTSLRDGWNAAQLQSALAAEVRYSPSTPATGAVAITVDQLKTKARQWGVPLSDQALQEWVQKITSGDATEEEFTAGYLKTQAKSLYPTLGGAIDRGITPEQYFDPYKQIAARTLEINPEQVDFTDPKWMKAVNMVNEKGERLAMSLSDWETHLKKDPAYNWRYTKQAGQQAADITERILKQFGAVA